MVNIVNHILESPGYRRQNTAAQEAQKETNPMRVDIKAFFNGLSALISLKKA
jgi:hypothetical protein